MAEGNPDGADVLKQILEPVIHEVVEARARHEGIVFVFSTPGRVAKQSLKLLGVKPRGKKTTVFGLTCEEATRAFGHDMVTKRWTSTPPADDQIKVFLVAGDGTALLTLSSRDGQVEIEKRDRPVRAHEVALWC